jgi:DNA-binding NarL/FixJ family response regulator
MFTETSRRSARRPMSLVAGIAASGALFMLGSTLTRREREVLGHLARGLSLPDIAAAMTISVTTARNHTQRVIEKLGAHSKLEAVVVAMREGLIAAPGVNAGETGSAA